MICPVCKHSLSQHSLLESNLPAYQCENCGGIWISAQEYMRWLKQQKTVLPERPTEDVVNIPTWDTPQLKICPTCKHFLIRYRVLPNVQFYLDRCGNCNGVWLDKNEWEVLVEHNLHDKVNQFFTQPWQTKVREEETHAMLDKMYQEKFKPEDYAKLKEVRVWLKDHPQRSMLLAYLQADNPYKI
jgi:Zn-finger nucleic acid-binding protein